MRHKECFWLLCITVPRTEDLSDRRLRRMGVYHADLFARHEWWPFDAIEITFPDCFGNILSYVKTLGES
ncbi:2705_t:CDS:2 [Paraglomus brasilianum]|uniref:2705_t:CDS:1 n=1 Tax=Paraglomus brasilianum TaxID=144538 RepID=A0A9N9BAC1_9GLOM|nr:2705_t:CDS:2 [Paraglomus brasilianum]